MFFSRFSTPVSLHIQLVKLHVPKSRKFHRWSALSEASKDLLLDTTLLRYIVAKMLCRVIYM